MKANKPVILIAGVFLVALIVIAVYVGIGAQSIVSVSDVAFDGQKNVWVTSLVVNQNDELKFNKYTSGCTEGMCLLDKLSDGTEKRGNSQINVSFAQGTPYCSYPLFAKNYQVSTLFGLVGIQSIPYFELGNYVRNVPYDVTVFKNGTQTDKKTVNVGSSATTIPLVNGAVNVDNLGQLSGGVNCPDASGAVLVPKIVNGTVTSYSLINASQWTTQLNNITQAANRLDVSSVSSLLSTPPAGSPSSFYGTYPRISTITSSSRNMEVDLTRRAAYAFITVRISSEYADTVTYVPPNPTPQITVSLDKSSIMQSSQATMTVTVKNVGTSAGVFDFLPYTSKGFISYTPTSDATGTVAVNGTATRTFKVYGLVSGNDAACISVVGRQSGKEAHECKSITIQDNPAVPEPIPAPIPQPEPQPVEPCTGIFCLPEPKPTPEPTPEQPNPCVNQPGTHLVTTTSPGFFGIGATTQNECVPDLDVTLIGIALIFAAVIISGIYLVTRKRRGK